MSQSEYAKAGVDYSVLEPFKQAMIAVGKKTVTFPNKRDVYINTDVMHSHGAVYEYKGPHHPIWCKTQEGLGNKNWIAEWMYDNEGSGKTYYDAIAKDTALMVANDVIAQGAMPVVFTDHIDVGDVSWFKNEQKVKDFADGLLAICEEVGMALPAGETAALKYLLKPEPPVQIAPTFSGSITGVIAPRERLVTGAKLSAGDHIIAVASSGVHSNGISLVIKRAMELPDTFLTKLPNGNTLGAETLIPTRSYTALIETLLDNNVDIHSLLPGTGDALGKIAYDKRPYTYRIHSWLSVPPLMTYFRENGLSLQDCLKTFNWGAGYYVFVPASDVDRTLKLGKSAGYELMDVGVVENGARQVIFEPENITLLPPGE